MLRLASILGWTGQIAHGFLVAKAATRTLAINAVGSTKQPQALISARTKVHMTPLPFNKLGRKRLHRQKALPMHPRLHFSLRTQSVVNLQRRLLQLRSQMPRGRLHSVRLFHSQPRLQLPFILCRRCGPRVGYSNVNARSLKWMCRQKYSARFFPIH